MMEKTTVYTIGQYIMQGFTAEEALIAREHDILFNLSRDRELTEKEQERFFHLAELLVL